MWVSFRDYIYESTLTTTTSYWFSFAPGGRGSPPSSPPYEKPPPRRTKSHPPRLCATTTAPTRGTHRPASPEGRDSLDSTSATFGSRDAPSELLDALIEHEMNKAEEEDQSENVFHQRGKKRLRKQSRNVNEVEHSYYNIPSKPSGSQSNHSYYNVPLHGKGPPVSKAGNQSEHSYYNIPPTRAPRIRRQNAKDPAVHRHTPPYTPDHSLPKYRNYRQMSAMLYEDLEGALLRAQDALCVSENALPVLSHTDSIDHGGLSHLPRQKSYDRWSQMSTKPQPLPYTPIQQFEYDTVPLSPTFTQFKPPTPPLPRKHFETLIIPDPPSEPAPSPPGLAARSTSWPSALAVAGTAGKKKHLRVRFSETEIIIPPEPEIEYEPEVQGAPYFRADAEYGASVIFISASQDVIYKSSALVPLCNFIITRI